MYPVHSVESIRAAEAEAFRRTAPGELMQRAAAGLAAAVVGELQDLRRVSGATVVIAVGPGHNGGDGLFAGVRLLHRGVRVLAWRATDTVHDDGWAAFLAAGGGVLDAVGALELLPDADLVLDAVFGIGARPGLPEDVATFAAACTDLGVPVVACDLPSGLDADSCNSGDHASFTATTTVTFGAWKPAVVLEPGRSRCGARTLVDIGLDLAEPDFQVWEIADLAAHLPRPDARSDKYSRGVVGLDTGSAHYPGAGVLSTLGAVYAGAGMVRYLGPATDAVSQQLPNVVLADGRVQATLLGSGWGDRADGADRVAGALANRLPVVLDADALACLPNQWRDDRQHVLLTPHAGELARLLDVDREDVAADPIAHARTAAARTGATVLLKGASQYVVSPDGSVTVAFGGPAWTAQAGSGDVLAGMCATFLAAGLDPRTAALTAASLQALAAARNPGTYPPQDLARRLPGVIASL